MYVITQIVITQIDWNARRSSIYLTQSSYLSLYFDWTRNNQSHSVANQYATVIRPWDSEFNSENEICIKLHSLFFKWRKKNFKTCNTFFLYFKQICKTKIFFGYILFVTQTLCYHYHYELLKMKVKLRISTVNQKKKLSITTFIINSSFIL